MNKKFLLYIITAAILVAIIFGYFSIKKNENTQHISTLDAIPLDANFIIELNQPSQDIKQIKQSPIFDILLKTKQFNLLNKQLNFVDSLLTENKTLNNILEKGILISCHNSPTGVDFIISFKLTNSSKQKKLLKEIQQIVDTTNTETYNNVEIFSNKHGEKEWYYTICDNIFVLSHSKEKLKESIRQILSKNPINLNLGFKEVNSLTNNKMKIFVNYEIYPALLKKIVSSKQYTKVNKLYSLALWSGMNFDIDKNLLSFSGYTSVSKEYDKYLSVFTGLRPASFEEAELLPYKVSEFLSISIRDFAKFYSNYQKYLSTKNLTAKYNTMADNFYNKYKIKVQPLLIPLLDGNLTFVNCIFNTNTNKISKFLLIKSNDIKKFQGVLQKIQVDSGENKEVIDSKKNIDIIQIKNSDFLRILFDQLANFPDFSYYTVYNDYLIFGQSVDEIKMYYIQLYREKTLKNNKDFNAFKKNISDKSNLFYYSNNLYNYNSEVHLFKGEFKDFFKQNLSFFKKMQFITFQFSYLKGNIFQTYANIQYNDNPAFNGLTNWEIELNKQIKVKPMIFINHNTHKKELFVIDKNNIVYLINREGQILWQKQVNEEIVGSPYMVDLYKNSKYQIIFATKNHIITLDRNGEIVKEKTISLPDSTDLGIFVFDYNNNRNYRVFVPIGNKLYLYNKDLKQVQGWKIPETKSKIISKIYHFVENGKDYIVFASKSKVFILNRRGETKIEVKENISFGQNPAIYFQSKAAGNNSCFITSDASGNIIKIDLSGSVKTKKIASVSNKHYFVAEDLNNDENLDYIFADENFMLIYDNNGDPIFAHTFKGKVSKPTIMKFSDTDIKIAITDVDNNLLYMFNPDGTPYKDFPVTGNSYIRISNLYSKNFNLITGFNNYLYSYNLY